MLSSRTWRFLVVLSSATARLVSPAHAAEAAVSFSEPAGVSHEERASAEPFGRATEKVLDGEILSRWVALEERLREENNTLANCDEDMSNCPRAAKLFLALLSEAGADRGLPRIGILNRANQHRDPSHQRLLQMGSSRSMEHAASGLFCSLSFIEAGAKLDIKPGGSDFRRQVSAAVRQSRSDDTSRGFPCCAGDVSLSIAKCIGPSGLLVGVGRSAEARGSGKARNARRLLLLDAICRRGSQHLRSP